MTLYRQPDYRIVYNSIEVDDIQSFRLNLISAVYRNLFEIIGDREGQSKAFIFDTDRKVCVKCWEGYGITYCMSGFCNPECYAMEQTDYI